MKITYLIGHMVKERDLILYELAEDLARLGAEVTVISGYPSRRISAETRKFYIEHPIEQPVKNLTIIRVGSKEGEGTGLFIRMIKYIFLTLRIFSKVKEIRTDVFYIYSTPPFLGYLSKRLREIAPVLYNAQDLFPDSLIVAKKLSESNPLVKFFRRRELCVYNESDAIVTISEDMKNHIISLGANESKVNVIQNWCDTVSVKPIPVEENILYQRYGISQTKFTVLYAGDIGYHQRLNLFLDVAECINKDQNNIQFVFFGNGAYVKTMKEAISQRKIANFYIFPLQPVNLISETYSLGHIDIVSLERGMTQIALPSKLWSVMSVARPVLALLDAESVVAKEIDKKYGYVIDGMTPHEVSQIIINCSSMKSKLVDMGIKAREHACSCNARSRQTLKYYQQLNELVTKKQQGNE